MKKTIYLFVLLLTIATSCTEAKKKNKIIQTIEISDNTKPDNFIDYILDNMDEQGHFLSLLVSDGKQIKCLVIENGTFYKLYTENKYHKREYAKRIKADIDSKKPVLLSSSQFKFLSTNLIDTVDYLSDRDYSMQLNIYFENGSQKTKVIPREVLLKITQKAFEKEYFIYRDGELGRFHVKKWQKI